MSIHLLPPHLHGDNYILIATDISDLKNKEFELNDIIVRLALHIDSLRALRIDNISETVDIKDRKNQLEITNDKLYKEIMKLNRLVEKLKKKQRNT